MLCRQLREPFDQALAIRDHRAGMRVAERDDLIETPLRSGEAERVRIERAGVDDLTADDLGERKDAAENIKTPLQWVSFKQQFFTSVLILHPTTFFRP